MRKQGNFSAVLLAGTLLSFATVATAQGAPESLRAANELFQVMSKDMVAQLTDRMVAQTWPAVEIQLRTAAKIDDATLKQLHEEFLRIQRDNLAAILKGAPAIYANHFSAEELRELTTFYRSPLGKKALRELPQISSELMQLMSPRLQESQKQTSEAFTRILREHGYRN